jgi:CxC2 like cysteine cluster associated with KDZ transposases
MRGTHKENPFHRIQRWNGSYYRRAALSEVGTYLLVRHYTGDAICDGLRNWCNMLDSAEQTKDRIEQDELFRYVLSPETEPVSDVEEIDDMDFDIENDLDLEETEEVADDGGDEEEEMEGNTYFEDAGAGVDPAVAALTLGSLHRVVHTNGVHHIAMVSCQCKGNDVLPLDLFAAHLIPASFKRIKTIFTAQVLDHYRFCNLELKASAYQFYQMLRRLTSPMAPAEVDNLYREFRRMTRIWRWMKKLKWAGYAGSSKKVNDVAPGELAIFCPACPQQGINIPDNWREDNARHVHIIYLYNWN